MQKFFSSMYLWTSCIYVTSKLVQNNTLNQAYNDQTVSLFRLKNNNKLQCHSFLLVFFLVTYIIDSFKKF